MNNIKNIINKNHTILKNNENNSNENIKSLVFNKKINNQNNNNNINNNSDKSINFNNNKNLNEILNENENIIFNNKNSVKEENENSDKIINFENKNKNQDKYEDENQDLNKTFNKNDDENSKKKNIFKKKDNSTKSININNNSNNDIDNVLFFNENEENNVTKFFSGDNNIIIEEEVAIKPESIIYKNDLVYLKELENQLLSEYPISKQNEKFIQILVENNAKKIIELKNIGILANNMFKKDIEYKLIDDLINEKFIYNNILPIVLDKHKIYVKLEEEGDENIESAFSETFENKNGIIEINQKTQFIELNKLFHNRALENIKFKNFQKEFNNITKPYINIDNKNGFNIKLKSESNVLRYFDYDTMHWNTHIEVSNLNSVKDIFDDLGKIIGTENYPLVEGNNINLVGFMRKNNEYLKKEFKEIGTITKITNSNNNFIKLEIINHGLIEEEYNFIYINQTNCFPKINNLYRKSVKILDKNNIELKLNEKLLINGTFGKIYTIAKLKYNLYNIKKENDKILIVKNFKKEIDSPINIYLFDNLTINKNDYESILKQIMPSLNNIINENLSILNKSYSFDDINSILNKNYINIDSLKVEQIVIIKDILMKNLIKYEQKNIFNKNNKYILNFNKLNINLINNQNYFLSDNNITNNDLIKYYTPYIHYKKPEDNFILRLKWLLSQKDNGEYFMINFNNIKKIYNKSYIKNKIEELTSLLNNIEKNFKKEKNSTNFKNKLYNYEAKLINDYDDTKKLTEGTLVFLNNILYKISESKKLDEIKNIEDNSLLLIDNNIYKWNKKKWEKTNIQPKYNNIKYLCDFNNIEIKDLKLDSLDCIYRKDIGCKSKLYVRLEDSLLKTKNYLSDFKKLLDYNELKDFNLKINFLKDKFFNGRIIEPIKLKVIKKEENILSIKKEQIDNLSVLLNLIKKIDNYNTKLNYIYTLIEKDGLLINKDIFSKKYKKNTNICGHYYYFKKINYADNPNNKILYTDLMISIFGDNGDASKNYITCNNCGEILINNDYDETEGFSENGAIKKSRELWTKETVDKKIEKDKNLLDYIKSSNIEDKAFKEILINNGISIDDIEEALDISLFIVKNLFMKSGVILPNSELISIIVDSMQKIKRILPYRIFRIKEIKKYQDKGFSKEYIDTMESKEIFKNEYIKNKLIKKNCIITARFLISVQITVPILVRSSKNTICPFFSFIGDEGLSYMACILQEMQLISYTDKLKIKELLMQNLSESYNEFVKLSHIQKLFKIRKEYDLEISKKKRNYKFIDKKENNRINKIFKFENENNIINYSKEINKSKSITDLDKIKNKLVYRLKYLTYTIKNIVKDIIKKSTITDQYIGFVEISCCLENAESYLDYYYYIESKTNIKKFIDESNILYDNIYYFINSGSIHKFKLYNTEHFNGIYNNIIADDLNSSETVIKAVFEYFVDKGNYIGTRREYIGDLNNPIDFKTGLTKKEILSKNYSNKDYLNLLNEIEKHHVKYYNTDKKVIFDENQMDNMKKNSNENLDKEITMLINNVSKTLNKDNKFNEKYKKLFRNFGIFNLENDEKMINKTSREKIKYRERINTYKLNYIKKFYISKLKKYLSIINNYWFDSEIKIDFEPDKEKKIDLQKYIYGENKKLEPFFDESIRKYFIDLKTTYSNEEINSINGIFDIYNSSYENIKKYSDFNFNDAANVLLYILVTDLNKLINGKKEDTQRRKYICNFILILFEELDNEDVIFNECNTTFIVNNEIHERIEYLAKNISKKKDEGIFLLKSMFKNTKSIDYFGEKLEEQQELISDYEDSYKEKGKKELFEKYGYEPSENELKKYKNNYLSEIQESEKIDDYIDVNDYDIESGEGFDEMDYE